MASSDFETLLRNALIAVETKEPTADQELIQVASYASNAVAKVSEGAASLKLVPISPMRAYPNTYRLQLRMIPSEAPPSDLGVYQVAPEGYPIHYWPSYVDWEAHSDKAVLAMSNIGLVEKHFSEMLSKPKSRLVILIKFIKQHTGKNLERARPSDQSAQKD